LFMGVSLYFRNQEEKRMHETARLALERGQPIPTFSPGWAAPQTPAARQNSWIGLLIGGLVNIAVGSGLYVMLASMPGAYVARYCALIPGLVGVALLLASLIVGLASLKRSGPGGPPPMS
jgi:hypothetical protein